MGRNAVVPEMSMIEFELLKDAGVLVVKPKSALSADDFSEISRTIQRREGKGARMVANRRIARCKRPAHRPALSAPRLALGGRTAWVNARERLRVRQSHS